MKSLYYGWYMVGIALLVLSLLVGSTFGAFGLFVLPVSEDFGLSRADTNTAFIALQIGSAVAAPFAGRVLDRFPIRRIMAACAVLLGASFVTLGLSHSPWLSAAILALPLAVSILGAGTLTATVLVARWFTVRRSRAMALAVMGTSLGGVLVPPLVALLIEASGWRQTLVILGCTLTVTLLLLLSLVREKPGPADQEAGPSPRAAHDTAVGDSPASAAPLAPTSILRAPVFWWISLGTALTLGVASALMVTLIPLGLELDLGAAQAASLISVLSGASVGGKLLVAWLGDRIDKTLTLAGVFIAVGLICAALLFSQDYASLVGCCLLLGLATGTITPTFYSLLAARFGSASFGTANGLATPLLAVAGATCIRYAGEVFDRTGGYEALFISFMGSQLLAAAMMFLAWRSQRSARRRISAIAAEAL